MGDVDDLRHYLKRDLWMLGGRCWIVITLLIFNDVLYSLFLSPSVYVLLPLRVDS